MPIHQPKAANKSNTDTSNVDQMSIVLFYFAFLAIPYHPADFGQAESKHFQRVGLRMQEPR
jgi:hypothetical protein